jgi:hypothetical protein
MFIDVLQYINTKSEDKIRFKISPLVEFEYGREYSPGNWSGLIGSIQDDKDIIEVSEWWLHIYSRGGNNHSPTHQMQVEFGIGE